MPTPLPQTGVDQVDRRAGAGACAPCHRIDHMPPGMATHAGMRRNRPPRPATSSKSHGTRCRTQRHRGLPEIHAPSASSGGGSSWLSCRPARSACKCRVVEPVLPEGRSGTPKIIPRLFPSIRDGVWSDFGANQTIFFQDMRVVPLHQHLRPADPRVSQLSNRGYARPVPLRCGLGMRAYDP